MIGRTIPSRPEGVVHAAADKMSAAEKPRGHFVRIDVFISREVDADKLSKPLFKEGAQCGGRLLPGQRRPSHN
jgi:hypothetical protein